MPFDSALEDARDVLRRVFGHERFRGLQEGVIAEALAGRSAMAVLPTGGGKSLCYQIPAILRPGLAIVVSPLIALMTDQVAGLQQLGVAAERLDSNLTPEQRDAAWRRIGEGGLDLLYVSPEGLMQPSMLNRLSARPIALVAIDEAHCVSQWGHDFRPEYRMLGRLAEVFDAPRLAVTATADARTRTDIRTELRLEGAREFVDSFARPELRLSAERRAGRGHPRVEALVRERPDRTGVVYVGSRDGTEKLAERLQAAGAPALAYHARLDKAVRHARLTKFLEADAAVMVATVAFGMGIDKPDVRYVIHADAPASIEAYWQEVGRAGRDGEDAEGITLYGPSDLAWALRRMDGKELTSEVRGVQARKARQLFAMLDGATCRAAAVRRYFGEEGAEPCGRCDLCLAPPVLRDDTQGAQKVLSAVQRLGGRFGRGRVVNHLLGKSEDGREAALSTFGIGGDRAAPAWRDLVDQLLFDGLLREDPNDGRPILSLGDPTQVKAVYRGERRVEVRDHAKPARVRDRRRAAVDAALAPEAHSLFEALRVWRKSQAAAQAVPPYVIFHDRTLQAIAAERPISLNALAACDGVGQAKLSRYGEAVLALVRRSE